MAVVIPIGPLVPATDFALETHVVPRPEIKVDAKPILPGDELTVEDCCRMFEEAEEASQTARELSERDRDYYDGKQLTAEEEGELKKRGQPPVVLNMIRQKINYLVGLEKQQRTKPRCLPRTPLHENAAEASTDALRYVCETQGFQDIRSMVWKAMLVEGAAACCVTVVPKAGSSYGAPSTAPLSITPQGYSISGGPPQTNPLSIGPEGFSVGQPPQFDVKLRFYAWDRFFADPHSARLDYSDASYLGNVLWMDRADAVAMYGADVEDVFDSTLSTGAMSETYDDKPVYTVWADRKRRRVRIVQMWIKRAGEWYFAEFTKGGFLKTGASPHVSDDGKTDCEIVAQSAYVDRDNNRYGEVRELVSPQDEINKRRSKSLHILNTAQVVAEEGAVADEEKARREAVKPDGWITLNPGMSDKFRFETKGEMANGQFKLLEHTMNVFQLMGANAAMQGNAGDSASGRAILASQQGGMIQTGQLLDGLREFDKRVYRAIWNRIRQYWTGPMWLRVTDDERNVRFVGINGAPDPANGQPGVPVAQLDVDIIIDDAPDGVAPAIEQFNAMVELKKFDTGNELSFRTILEAMPNLRNKDKLLDQMDKQHAQAQQAGPPPEIQAKMAELQLKQQEAEADAQRENAKAMAQDQQARQRAETEKQIAFQRLEIEDQSAEAASRREWAATMAKIEAQRQLNDAKIQQDMALAAFKAKTAADAKASDDQSAAASAQESANLAQVLAHIAEGVDELKDYAGAPKTIIRGDNGVATHVRTGLGIHKVMRDATGAPTGLGPVMTNSEG
jgi:hypothetical protein